MKDTFKAYLSQQKADNKYTTAPSMEILDEANPFARFTANKKYDCYAVTLDFTSEYMVKTLTNVLINEYKANSGESGNKSQNPAKSIIAMGPDEFAANLKDKIYEMIAETVKATKNLRTFFGLGKESSALACIQEEENKSIKYIFFKASEKNPKAYAERFRDEVGRNSKISLLKKGMDIVEESYYKSDIVEARKSSIYINPEKHKEKIESTDFMNTVVAELQDKVTRELNEAGEKMEKGHLISVYSIPFKIDDTLIKEVANKHNDVTSFYDELADKINKELVEILKQIPKLDDYIGFIPTKSYGFNLYFKDKDTAAEVAEKLNQDGSDKVTEKKRYEKKMTALYKLLGKSNDFTDLSYATDNPADFFRGTLFARTHVAELIKEKLPSAEDQLVIYQYVVKYDNDELKNFLHHFDLDATAENIRNDVKEKLKAVLENLQKVYNDDLVSMTSEGSNLVFMFRKSASISGVQTRIANAMSCELNRIKVTKTALTKKEVDSFKEKIAELNDLESFYKAVEKLNGETVKLFKCEITLKDEIIKKIVDDQYKEQALDFLNNITKLAETAEGFAGITVPGKDEGLITLYLKDKESLPIIKDAILQKYDNEIKSFTDNLEEVTLNRVDADKLNSMMEGDNLINYFKNILDDKNEEDAQVINHYVYFHFIFDKLLGCKVKDYLTNEPLWNQFISTAHTKKESTQMSFEETFKMRLMESIKLYEASDKASTDGVAIKNALIDWFKEIPDDKKDDVTFRNCKGTAASTVKALFNTIMESTGYRLTHIEGFDRLKKEASYKINFETGKLFVYVTKRVAHDPKFESELRTVLNMNTIKALLNNNPHVEQKHD